MDKPKSDYEKMLHYVNKWRYDYEASDKEVVNRMLGWLEAKVGDDDE